METLINTIGMPFIGTALTILLGVISFFLMRLLNQFDKLTDQVGELNKTMIKIDKDLSGDVSVLKQKTEMLNEDLLNLNQLWDRVRAAENDIISIKAGGCNAIKHECKS